MRFRMAQYLAIVAVLEKHGYEVVRSIDKKTIYVTKNSKPSTGREIISIFDREGLLSYLDYLEPQALRMWKITLS